MNLFKLSYKHVRKESEEIYKGFGFKHLSDATHYYVHPDNQSYKGTTTLCQPIGEAVILFASMLTSIHKGNAWGDYYVSGDKQNISLNFVVPQDYKDNGVVDKEVYRYAARTVGNMIMVGAFDEQGDYLFSRSEESYIDEYYKMLPAFCLLLAKEMEINSDFRDMMEDFCENPAVDTFVNLHEDFYQNHKLDDNSLSYGAVSNDDISSMNSYSDTYLVIKQNKDGLNSKKEIGINAFDDNVFTEEQKKWIPQLTEEFILPKNLNSVCNAITSGDMLAVLFHGPAGTGKTMSCKLVAQAVKLPIMETINCTENLDEFVLGKFIPDGDQIIFKESYVTKAIRDGGAVVFEEINFAKPQHLAFLNSLLDDNGFVRLDNGEVVKRNKNFRFFATMNIGYFGTKELNQALYNRFSGIIEIAELSDYAITRMLTARVPECEPVVDKIISVYHKIKKKIEAEELDVVISPRNLENWARLAKYDGYVSAAEKTIIPIAKCDRVLENSFRGIIMLYKWE